MDEQREKAREIFGAAVAQRLANSVTCDGRQLESIANSAWDAAKFFEKYADDREARRTGSIPKPRDWPPAPK